jgi:hypothetical protein
LTLDIFTPKHFQEHFMPEQTLIQSIPFTDLPALGQPLNGGIFRGITTKKDGTHCAVIRLPGKGEDLNWKDSKAWAAEQGGQLPSKAVGAMLASNEELERDWYWTEEEYEASFAWGFLSNGTTFYNHKSAAGGALSVRLIPITA